MTVKQSQTKRGNHWRWLLAIIFGPTRFGLILAPAWAVLTPSPVDTQVKVKFSAFKFNKPSNTYDGKAEFTNRSAQPIQTPIRLAIKNIKSKTVSLAKPTGLLADGSGYVEMPLIDGILSSGAIVKNTSLTLNKSKRYAHMAEPITGSAVWEAIRDTERFYWKNQWG